MEVDSVPSGSTDQPGATESTADSMESDGTGKAATNPTDGTTEETTDVGLPPPPMQGFGVALPPPPTMGLNGFGGGVGVGTGAGTGESAAEGEEDVGSDAGTNLEEEREEARRELQELEEAEKKEKAQDEAAKKVLCSGRDRSRPYSQPLIPLLIPTVIPTLIPTLSLTPILIVTTERPPSTQGEHEVGQLNGKAGDHAREEGGRVQREVQHARRPGPQPPRGVAGDVQERAPFSGVY